MSEATTFFKNQIENAILRLNTAMPCKVLSFDDQTITAKVQPLFMSKEVGHDPEPLPPIENVPVLFQRYQLNNNEPISITTDSGAHSQYSGTGAHIHNTLAYKESIEMTPDLRAGDIVLVIFTQRALDNVLSGTISYPNINRHHSLNDAVIVGVM